MNIQIEGTYLGVLKDTWEFMNYSNSDIVNGLNPTNPISETAKML